MKYKVYYVQSSVVSAEVEADSFEQAKEIAEGMDGGEFSEDPTTCDWEFFGIQSEDGHWEE